MNLTTTQIALIEQAALIAGLRDELAQAAATISELRGQLVPSSSDKGELAN